VSDSGAGSGARHQADPSAGDFAPLSGVELGARRHAVERADTLPQIVMDAAPVLEAFIDKDHCYRLVNAAYEEWFGMPREVIVGRPMVEILGEAAYRKVLPYVHQALNGERAGYQIRFSFPRRGERDVETVLTPHRDATGEVVGFCVLVQDITELKQVEQALRRSRDTLQGFYDSSSFMMGMAELEGDTLIAVHGNKAGADLFGVTPESLANKTGQQLGSPEAVHRIVLDRCLRSQREGVPVRFEIEFPSHFGMRWINATVSYLGIGPRGRAQFSFIADDFTERKRTEQITLAQARLLEMVASGAPLQAILDNLARTIEALDPGMLAAILLLEEDGKHLSLSSAPSLDATYLREMSRIPVGEGYGSCGTAAWSGKTVIVEDIASDPLWSVYQDVALASGLRACWATPILDADASVLGIFAVYSRVPQRPLVQQQELVLMATHVAAIAIVRDREERALRESEEHLRLAEASASVGVWEWDIQTGKVKWTAQMEVLYGCAPGTFSGTYAGFAERVHPDDLAAIEASMAEALATHRPFDFEFRILLPGGGTRWVNAKGAAHYDETGAALRVSGVNIDITEQKRIETERIAQLERQRDTLVREVHHRIKNHLQGVVGLLRNRLGQQPDLGPALQEAIDQIRIIAEVYGLQSQQNLADVPLGKLAATVSQGNVAPVVCVDCAIGTSPLVALHEVMPIALIVNELVTNALKHRPASAAAKPIRIELARKGDDALLRVRGGPAQLPAEFNFALGRGAGTGLELIRALLPATDAGLSYRQEGDEVVAELLLCPPVIFWPAPEA